MLFFATRVAASNGSVRPGGQLLHYVLLFQPRKGDRIPYTPWLSSCSFSWYCTGHAPVLSQYWTRPWNGRSFSEEWATQIVKHARDVLEQCEFKLPYALFVWNELTNHRSVGMLNQQIEPITDSKKNGYTNPWISLQKYWGAKNRGSAWKSRGGDIEAEYNPVSYWYIPVPTKTTSKDVKGSLKYMSVSNQPQALYANTRGEKIIATHRAAVETWEGEGKKRAKECSGGP